MNIQSVIEKIQKLRKLSRSDNIHEAEAAAAAADRLIQEHGLAEAQLEAEGAAPVEKPSEDAASFVEWHGNAPTWQRILSSGLVRHYDCACYLKWIWVNGRNRLALQIIGRPSDIATARYMYGWLALEIDRLAKEASRGQGKAYADSFRRGAVSGVIEKLRLSRESVRQEAEARNKVAQAINPELKISAALAIYDRRREEAREAMHATHPDIAASAKRSRGGSSYSSPSRYDGYTDGKRAGANIHTGAALGGGGTSRRLGS